MIVARLLLALVLIGFAGYIAAMNWACVFVSWRNKRRRIDRHHSTVPVVTLALAVGAMQAWPFPSTGWFWVVPLIDVGNWTLILLPVALARGAFAAER